MPILGESGVFQVASSKPGYVAVLEMNERRVLRALLYIPALLILMAASAGFVSADENGSGNLEEDLFHSRPADPVEKPNHRIVTLAPGGPLLESPILSRVHYYRAVREIASGGWKEARNHLSNAVEGDPSLVRAHLLLSLVHLRELDPKWILFLFDAGKALQGNFRSQSLLLANGVFFGILLTFTLLLFLTLAGVLRNLPYLNHAILEKLPPAVPALIRPMYPVVFLLSIGILLRPWQWIAAMVWLLAIFVFLAWKGFTRWERFVSSAFLIYLCLSPFLIRAAVHVYAPTTPGSTLFSLSGAPASPLNDQRITSLAAKEPDDGDILFSLALLEREKGNVSRAMDLYREMLRTGYESVSVFNNIGNLLFLDGKKEMAFAAYEEALRIDPERATSHYNLGQLYLETFSFDKARSEFSKASDKNFSLIRSLSRISRNSDRLTLVDESLPTAHLWGRYLSGRSGVEGATLRESFQSAQQILFPFSPPRFLPLLALLLLAFLFGNSIRRPIYCIRCGRTICRKCRVRVSSADYCSACAGTGKERIWGRDTLLYHRPVAIVLTLLFPGSAHAYLGKRFIGIFYMTITLSLLIGWAFHGAMLKPFPVLDGSDLVPLENLIFLLVFAPLYLWIVVDAFLLISRSFQSGASRRVF